MSHSCGVYKPQNRPPAKTHETVKLQYEMWGTEVHTEECAHGHVVLTCRVRRTVMTWEGRAGVGPGVRHVLLSTYWTGKG